MNIMNEMTYENSGQPENDPSVWPSDDQIQQLAIEGRYCFEDYFYLRRYLTLSQMQTLREVATALDSSFPAVAIGYLKNIS